MTMTDTGALLLVLDLTVITLTLNSSTAVGVKAMVTSASITVSYRASM